MKAAVCTRYGPPEVLQVRDVDDPTPRGNDVVIRIRAATVTASDVFIRSAIPSGRLVMRLLLRVFVGFRRPRRPILGAVLAGEIESIGKNVTRFRVGDRVWAFTSCDSAATPNAFACRKRRSCSHRRRRT
jgi:NADPH:quinone reductase-like Zn-dependent oxidoreductase